MAQIDLDQKIKQAVKSWRENRYEGATEITKRLLEFWFKEEHIKPDGLRFEFWRCQQEAIEALIYVYEVCKFRSLYELSRGFNVSLLFDPTKDTFPKYCFKMATGSGKTFVMAMAIVWDYFNKTKGTNKDIRYSTHFLMLAPNLIVLDRLAADFQNNKIFKDYPFIPPEWQAVFDLQVILQSQNISKTSTGILHLTNIQQLYERENEDLNPVSILVGSKPKREEEIVYESLRLSLSNYDDLLVLNDEAHHVHSDDLEWNRVITELDTNLREKKGRGLAMQLDFSATPKFLEPGDRYFPHIIYDYSLSEAIKDKIVKRPRIGEIENIPVPLSKDFVKRNQLQIDTGLEVLKEFKKEFKHTAKRPVLFIMTDNTKNADKVGEYLKKHKGFKEKEVLVIHTDTKGVITKKDLEEARIIAREIDKPETKVKVIISVMMLKEGWDVRSVCVIVPLRAFDSPILPEQTLGRGLRRIEPEDKDWEERLIVVDHPRFRQLWQAEIEKGEIIVDITSAKKVYEPANMIMVDTSKLKFDIEIPVLSGGIVGTAPDLSKLDVKNLPKRLFNFEDINLPKVMYKERDLIDQKIVRKKELGFDYTDKYEIYLSYMAKAILSKVGASSLFSELIPKLEDYIQSYLFNTKIDITDSATVKKLNYIPIRENILEVFTSEISRLSRKEEEVKITKSFKASETLPFLTSDPVYKAKKTVFDYLPYSKRSEFEKEFMVYLDEKDGCMAYTKVLSRFPLHIPYYNQEGYIRHYTPDFIVKAKKQIYLIETKGMEEIEFPFKKDAAMRWCNSVSLIGRIKWSYAAVLKDNFGRLRDLNFEELVRFCG